MDESRSGRVVWLIRAQEKLQNSQSAVDASRLTIEQMAGGLTEQLEKTFPTARSIVVVDVLYGYSSGGGSKPYVLRVEAFEEGRSQGRIVKIGSRSAIRRELANWESCRRPASERGRVLMKLSAGYPQHDADDCPLQSLVYEDAQQSMWAGHVMNLEEGTVSCCRFGMPTVSSLVLILGQLYTELACSLYERAKPVAADKESTLYWQKRIERGLEQWLDSRTICGEARIEVLKHLPVEPGQAFDPCEMVPLLLTETELLPEMLRGPAHGDVNGRNVLVGLRQDEALWATAFDYEHMQPELFVGWDYVKLECELKIRIYPFLFSHNPVTFAQELYRFENELSRQTEALNEGSFSNWKEMIVSETAADRLSGLLLTLRQNAKWGLETIQKRSRRWLHEYYFLQALYGVCSGRHECYSPLEARGAYLAAMVALARFLWGVQERIPAEPRAMAEARLAIAAGRHEHVPRGRPWTSHQAGLAFAREYVRSRKAPFVATGVKYLAELWQHFEKSHEVGLELALGKFELADLQRDPAHRQDAESLFQDIEKRFGDPETWNEETWCRFGRFWKDCGDLSAEELGMQHPRTQALYEKSLHYYEQGSLLQDGYYPKVNAATLRLLIGDVKGARRLAREIKQALYKADQSNMWDDETIWQLASRAEAELVLGEDTQAADDYRRLLAQSSLRPHERETMRKQVARIMMVHGDGTVCWDDVFRRS